MLDDTFKGCCNWLQGSYHPQSQRILRRNFQSWSLDLEEGEEGVVHNEVGWGCGVASSSISGGIRHCEPHGQIQLPSSVTGYGAVFCNVLVKMVGV